MDSFTLIDQDLARGVLDINQAAQYKVYALFESPLLPFQYQSNVLIPLDGLAAYVNAIENWSQLDATTKQTLTEFLTPKDISSSSLSPRLPGLAAPIPGKKIVGCNLVNIKSTAHFQILYGALEPCAATDVYIDLLATGLETAWSRYAELGYRVPNSFTVFVVPLHLIPGSPGLSPPDAIFFDNNIPLSTGSIGGDPPDLFVKALAAHEFFHSVQWMYFPSVCPKFPAPEAPWNLPSSWQLLEDVRWWMEASAQWAQQRVYPDDKSYYHSVLSNFLERPWQHLDTRPKSLTDPLSNFPYGTVLFPTYLTEKLDSSGGIIRVSWEKYSQRLDCGSIMPALQEALLTRGTSVEPTFPRFAEANYLLDYTKRSDFLSAERISRAFDDRADRQSLSEQLPSVAGPGSTYGGRTVERLGTAYIEFNNRFANPPIGRALTITVDIFVSNATADPVVKLWAVKQYTPTLDVTVITPQFSLVEQIGSGRHYVAKAGIPGFDSYERVGMAVINPQVSGASLNYTYSAGVVPPAVLYAGQNTTGQNPNVFVSTNGGATWRTFPFTTTASIQAVAAIPKTQGQVGYVMTSDMKLWKTTNAGGTFSTIYDNFNAKLQGVITFTRASLITIDPKNPDILYVGIRGSRDRPGDTEPEKGVLFRSTNGGATFGDDLLKHCHENKNPADWQDCAITSVKVDPTNSNVLWLGQNGFNAMPQALMRSSDGGQTWQTVREIQNSFTEISISPTNSNVVWVLSREGTLRDEQVYRTIDGGTSWNAAKVDTTRLPDALAILADPFNVSAAWESAGQEGLKRSTDGNQSWQQIYGRFFNALYSTAPQVLYANARFASGAASIEWSPDGGSTWFNLGLPEMVEGGVLSVVAW